jgi:acyl-coenzyme A thioesterase 13
MTDIPDGYKPLKRGGGYLTSLGPWYYRRDEQGRRTQMVLAIRVEDRHCNIRHIAHGGFLVSMFDTALGIVVSSSREPPQPIVTVSLTTNFVSSAEPGDWVEAHVDHRPHGRAPGLRQLHAGLRRTRDHDRHRRLRPDEAGPCAKGTATD